MDKVQPWRIRLEASSFCQLRCPTCSTTERRIDAVIGKGFLRFEDFRRLIDLNPSIKIIELANYGEVFLNPHLLRILEHAHRKGVSLTLDSGVNLNTARDEALEGLVKYSVSTVSCSIDGASPETYRKYRVRGNFNTVITNIKRINYYKQVYRTEFPRLDWQFIVFVVQIPRVDVSAYLAANRRWRQETIRLCPAGVLQFFVFSLEEVV